MVSRGVGGLPATFRSVTHAAFLCLLMALFNATPGFAADVRVAVAANFKPTLDELATAFEDQSGHNVIVTSGSTGKLYAQIINGAPFDVFLAADQARPRLLEEGGAGLAGHRFTYAIGQLALWAPAAKAVGPERLKAGAYRRLAIANPDLAPYGVAAMQILSALGYDAAASSNKLVYGENVGQAFAFIRTGNVDIGLVALSQVLATPPEARGAHWTPPQELYDPIRQDAILLARAADNAAAQEFADFLKSDDAAAAIIVMHGYLAP